MKPLIVPPQVGPAHDQSWAAATHKLTKRFGAKTALSGVDIRVPTGGLYLLVGANGAGKSTLLQTLLNISRPDSGSAAVLGLDPQKHGPACRAMIGYVPELADAMYGWPSADRLLRHHAAHYPTWDPAYAARLADALSLPLNVQVRSLSKGQRRRLQLLLALAPRPPLLILDEPTEGLDPVAREDLRAVLAEHMADTGCTIILSTHQVADVEGLADHIGVLKHGKLLAQVPRDSLREGMRIYSADGPPGWTGPTDLPGLVLHSQKRGREASWTVFGDVSEVIAGVARSGGVVRDVATMSLDEAVVALLRVEEAA